ncbi:MAG: methionine ABC transporter ATP-binding protein [Sphaerochaetaceae bacterium]|nr:methionine ABC transporter ATP-binding protein [Sphaerochaetaceae bacterium]
MNQDILNNPIIELQNINVTFKSAEGNPLVAVSDVSLKVDRGEIFGIVGSSGAGKSTLARVVNLLQKPTDGKVLIDGQNITDYRGDELRKLRLRIGMIFQHFNLISGLSVEDNVAFNLKAAGYPKSDIHSRVVELLNLVGLSDKLKSYPSKLSGGQKQRVAIARALANNPELLICDEATSALDPKTTDEIVSLLNDINKKLKITIVFITHQMEVAKKLFNRIAVMDSGKIVEINSTYSLFSNPTSHVSEALVSTVLDIEIPEELELSEESHLVKILYAGGGAYNPIISNLSKTFDVDLSILSGKIEYINKKPLGILLVSIIGEESERLKAIEYLKDNTTKVELIEKRDNNGK